LLRHVATLKALPFYQTEAKNRQRLSRGRGKKGAQSCATLKGNAAERAAKNAGISVRLVEMAKKVQEVQPKLIAEIEAGRRTVNEAYEVVAATNSGSHTSGDTAEDDRFRTPQKLFDALNNGYHFRLDACAEKEVAKCQNCFTPERNALRHNWAKFGSVFCNPPFYRKDLARWVVKGFGYLDAVREVFSSAPKNRVDLLPSDVDMGPYDQAYKQHDSPRK
jgi:hypothetical protein